VFRFLIRGNCRALACLSYLMASSVFDAAVIPIPPYALAAAASRPAAVVLLLQDGFLAVYDRDYAALATLVDGDVHELERVHRRGYLLDLTTASQWQTVSDHINGLSAYDVVEQLFHADNRLRAVQLACLNSAPLELFQLMIAKAKLDTRKRPLLVTSLASSGESAAVITYAASCHGDTAVLELLIREDPLGLIAPTRFMSPLQAAIHFERPDEFIALRRDATAALESCDYPDLAALVHGDAYILCRLALTPDRLLTQCPDLPQEDHPREARSRALS